MVRRKGCLFWGDLSYWVTHLALILVMLILLVETFFSAPKKNVSSITLYGYNGNILKQWNGELTLHQDNYQCYFDYEGRKIIVRGGILVAQ